MTTTTPSTTSPPDNVPTEQELRWATRLKQAARSDPELVSADVDEMSDWEFLQHAIVAKDNTRKALTRMRHLHAFKRRYGITRDGSVEEAARDFKAFFLAHPGLYMSMANNVDHHQHDHNNNNFSSSPSACPQIFCSTYDKFNATRMKSEEAFAVYMRAAFYALQASQHTIQALRGGMVLLMDIHGALRYRSYQTESRARELYGRAYPIRIRHVALLHASAAVRILCRYMIQPWLSPKVKQLWTVATDRTAYLQTAGWSTQVLPEEWGGVWAVSDLGDTMLDRLRQRYQNAETFRL